MSDAGEPKALRFVIRQIKESDIGGLVRNFARFNKHREQYEMFWREHQEGKRVKFVVIAGKELVGYANLVWQSDYGAFRDASGYTRNILKQRVHLIVIVISHIPTVR